MNEKLTPMTHDDFLILLARNRYYEGRWPYYAAALEMLEAVEYSSVLELGPYQRPLIDGADIMDRAAYAGELTFPHDATIFPWPVADKSYDLFIATQVWEHLQGRQREAFGEVIRCSRAALLSFPIGWNCLGDCHHGITEELVAEWTLHVPPVQTRRVDARMIWLYEFDEITEPRVEHRVGLRVAEEHLHALYPVHKKARRDLAEAKRELSAIRQSLRWKVSNGLAERFTATFGTPLTRTAAFKALRRVWPNRRESR